MMSIFTKRLRGLGLLALLWALPVMAQNARVQFIHNSGDIDTRPLNVFVGDSLYANISFRTATKFLNLPSGNVRIRLINPTAPRKDSLEAEVNLTLVGGGTYVCIFDGILRVNLGKYANPDPANRNIRISLYAVPNARETASNSAKVEFFVNNGNTDGPIGGLDFFTVGSTTPFIDNLGYRQSTAGYISVDPAKYTYDVRPGDDPTKLIGSYEGDFTAAAGKSAVVLASGFVDPTKNEGSQKLGLIAVFADGSVQAFRTIEILPVGKWKFTGASPYKFTDFIGADTLVNGGHGIVVDRRNRIWIGNFNAAGRLRVFHPNGSQDPISPIRFVKVGADSFNTSGCRGMVLDKDGSIIFARASRLFRVDAATGKAVKQFIGTGSLLGPMVDKDGFIWTGLVVGVNPISVIGPSSTDPNALVASQTITLKSPPGVGRGLGITADARTIITPDLGSNGGPLYLWTTTDFLNYTKTDSIYTNDKRELIMRTNRQTMNWHPKDSTLWVSVDRASTPVNNADNGFYVFDFKKLEYSIVSMPEIKNPTTGAILNNGPRNVAFSVSGDTAYAVAFDGSRLMRFVKGATAVNDKPLSSIPGTYELLQNYPNPFNPNTTIAYTLSQYAIVELKVYDNMGREVKTLVHKVMPPGRHEATFEATGLATGLYHYRLYVDGQVFTKSMMLLK
jgi:hypothetical protein